jgi:vacuolar-type H+-ATPase subunit H
MDLTARLQQLEDLVREAKSMPLSSSALVNRDEVLELIVEMKETLPEEIKQARWVVKDREELLGKARAEGERVVAEAEEEQLRMARREEIVARAEDEAERIIQQAEEDGRKIRLESEDYVDAKLAQFEIALRKIQEEARSSARQVGKTLDQIELGRQKLRGAPITEAEQRLGGRDLDEGPPPEPAGGIDVPVEESE